MEATDTVGPRSRAPSGTGLAAQRGPAGPVPAAAKVRFKTFGSRDKMAFEGAEPVEAMEFSGRLNVVLCQLGT